MVVLGYMVYLNWQLTLATLVLSPLMVLLIGWFEEDGCSLTAVKIACLIYLPYFKLFSIRLVQPLRQRLHPEAVHSRGGTANQV